MRKVLTLIFLNLGVCVFFGIGIIPRYLGGTLKEGIIFSVIVFFVLSAMVLVSYVRKTKQN